MYNNTNIEELLEQSKIIATQNPQESYDLAKKAMDLSKATHQPLSYGYSLFHMALNHFPSPHWKVYLQLRSPLA